MVILILLGGLGLVLFPKRVGEATVGVAAIGALPLGVQVELGLARGKYLPAGLHAAEASCVSSSSISVFLRLLLCVQCGLLKCLLLTHLLSSISLMGLWVLIQLSMLFGPGFA